MIKSIKTHSTILPSTFWGGFAAFVFVFTIFTFWGTESVSGQTRRTASAIPYSFEEQSADLRKSIPPKSSQNEEIVQFGKNTQQSEDYIDQLQFQSFAFLENGNASDDDPFAPAEVENFEEPDIAPPSELGEFEPLDDFGPNLPEPDAPTPDVPTPKAPAPDAFVPDTPAPDGFIPKTRVPDDYDPFDPDAQEPIVPQQEAQPEFQQPTPRPSPTPQSPVLQQSPDTQQQVQQPSPQTQETQEPTDGWQPAEPEVSDSPSAPTQTQSHIPQPQQSFEGPRLPPPRKVPSPQPQEQAQPTEQDSGLKYPKTDLYDNGQLGTYDEFEVYPPHNKFGPGRSGGAPVLQFHGYSRPSQSLVQSSCEVGSYPQFYEQNEWYNGHPGGYYSEPRLGNHALNNRCGCGRCNKRYDNNYGIFPIAGSLLVDPCAPLFDIGGPYINFWGYAKQGPPVRPYGWLFDNMTIFGGASAFGNKAGSLRERNIGGFEGINWSSSFSPRYGVGAQLGVRFVQRSLDGNHPLLENDEWNNTGKSQVFFTGGFFRRTATHPIQCGVVYDLMRDNKLKLKNNEKSLGNIGLGQIRTELSFRAQRGFTFGFQGAFTARHGDSFDENHHYQVRAVSYYLGFVEKAFRNGNAIHLSAGGTKHGNAMLTTMYYHPLTDRFSFQTNATYMFSKSGKNPDTSIFSDHDRRMAWEFGLTLTFHPHGGAFQRNCNPLRAMFDVAGNGSMLTSNRR